MTASRSLTTGAIVKRFALTMIRYRESPFRVFRVSPADIEFVTPPSSIADLTQHGGDRSHPHAFLDRGYFFERRIGAVIGGDWDRGRIRFADLLEYRSLADVIEGRSGWNGTPFARRALAYIAEGGRSRGCDSVPAYLRTRWKEVDDLIEGIRVNGVRRVSKTVLSRRFEDEIGVNVARDGTLLFNNRGHHRLAIAKLLGVRSVPVIPVVWHPEWIDRQGFRLPVGSRRGPERPRREAVQ